MVLNKTSTRYMGSGHERKKDVQDSGTIIILTNLTMKFRFFLKEKFYLVSVVSAGILLSFIAIKRRGIAQNACITYRTNYKNCWFKAIWSICHHGKLFLSYMSPGIIKVDFNRILCNTITMPTNYIYITGHRQMWLSVFINIHCSRRRFFFTMKLLFMYI